MDYEKLREEALSSLSENLDQDSPSSGLFGVLQQISVNATIEVLKRYDDMRHQVPASDS